MFTWRLMQGFGGALPLTVAACPVDSSLGLTATVSGGTTADALITFAPEWASSGPPNLILTLTGAQTASLAPGGYIVQVGLDKGAGVLAIGELVVLAAPGNAPAYDVLTTPGRVLLMDVNMRNNPDRVAMLPLALRSASELIRRFCYRRFTRGEYTEYHTPNLEGAVRLDEFPVHRIIRASWKLQPAVTILADPSLFQTAYVNYATQDDPFGDPRGATYTGINLIGTASGVMTTTTIDFADTPKLSDLATAIGAATGWSASAGGYGEWATSELYCDGASRGALKGDAALSVFSEDVGVSKVAGRIGMFRVGPGLQYADSFGPRWGPNWIDFAGDGWYGDGGIVRITYDAGFSEVPDAIQDATASMSRLLIDRMLTDFMVKKESIGDYSYELNDKLMSTPIPDAIRASLFPYVGFRA